MDLFGLFRDTAFDKLRVVAGAEMDGVRPVTDAFLAYWRGKTRADGGLPARRDIQPAEIPELLPHAVLLDVVPGEADARRLLTRLIGTHVSAYFGEITGRDIAAMSNAEAAKRIYHMAEGVIAERAPALSVVHGLAPGRMHLDAYAVYMPLAADDGRVRMLFVGVEVTVAHESAG